MSDAIISMAEKLGKAIADSPAAANLQQARDAVAAEDGTGELIEQFQKQSMKMAQLEHENKPIEVEDKKALQEIHGKLVSSPAFKKLTAAQVEFADLMRKVSQTIQSQLGADEE